MAGPIRRAFMRRTDVTGRRYPPGVWSGSDRGSAVGPAYSSSLAEILAVVALATASVMLAAYLSHPHIVGHDEGIYAAAGRALARDGQYSLINLPSEPPQTKYPPLYSALLAPIWLAFPDAPGNIPALKCVNAFLLGAAVVVFWLRLSRVQGLTPVHRVLGPAVLVSLPGVFSFTDLLISEVAFVLLVTALLLAVPPEGPVTPGRALVIGVLAGLVVLTRTAGVGIVAGLLIYLLVCRTMRTAALATATCALLTVPWVLWRALAISPTISPLEKYYVSYELSAWQSLFTDPGFTWRVVVANTGYYFENAPIVFGAYTPVLVSAAVILAVIGWWRHDVAERVLAAGVTLCYMVLVIGHPMPMERYLVPLAPLIVLLFVSGTANLHGWLSRIVPGGDVVAMAPLVILLAGNIAWLQHFAATTSQGPQWHFGRRTAFAWDGFAEVFAWIRSNTPPDAVLASGFDPIYFVQTGRRSIRPWMHQPELYVPSYRGTPRTEHSVEEIQRQLDALGVGYLIVDPVGDTGEGEHAGRTIDGLLQGSQWILVFESSNRLHRVYRRAREGNLPVNSRPGDGSTDSRRRSHPPSTTESLVRPTRSSYAERPSRMKSGGPPRVSRSQHPSVARALDDTSHDAIVPLADVSRSSRPPALKKHPGTSAYDPSREPASIVEALTKASSTTLPATAMSVPLRNGSAGDRKCLRRGGDPELASKFPKRGERVQPAGSLVDSAPLRLLSSLPSCQTPDEGVSERPERPAGETGAVRS